MTENLLRLLPPIRERWRRPATGTWAPIAVDGVGLVPENTVVAFSMRDGTTLWERALETGRASREDNRDRYVTGGFGVGGRFVLTSAFGWDREHNTQQGRIVALSPTGERVWVHDRRSGGFELLAAEGTRLELASNFIPDRQRPEDEHLRVERLIVDVTSGEVQVAPLPPSLRLTPCEGGVLFAGPRDGVYFQAYDATKAERIVPSERTIIALHAHDDLIVRIELPERRSKTHELVVWSRRAGRELWRRSDVHWNVDVGAHGILYLQHDPAGHRPVVADLRTGAQILVGDAIPGHGTGMHVGHAGDAILCMTSFLLRLLDPTTGKCMQEIAAPRSMGQPTIVAPGHLLLKVGAERVCYVDARVAEDGA